MAQLKQQINLYQPIFRKRSVLFSLSSLALLVALAIGAIALIQGYGYWQLQLQAEQLDSLQQRHAHLEKEVTRMAELLPEPESNRLLEQQLSSLQSQRQAGFALLNTLRARVEGNRDGLSGYFEGLARRNRDGLWFTRIRVTAGGDFLAMQGKALAPELLPKLLQDLQQEPAFDGKSFQVVQLQREEQGERTLSFDLVTSRGGEQE